MVLIFVCVMRHATHICVCVVSHVAHTNESCVWHDSWRTRMKWVAISRMVLICVCVLRHDTHIFVCVMSHVTHISVCAVSHVTHVRACHKSCHIYQCQCVSWVICMWKMTYTCEKWRIYVKSDLYMWKVTYISVCFARHVMTRARNKRVAVLRVVLIIVCGMSHVTHVFVCVLSCVAHDSRHTRICGSLFTYIRHFLHVYVILSRDTYSCVYWVVSHIFVFGMSHVTRVRV